MRVQRPEKNIHVSGGFRQPEAAGVLGFVLKLQAELEFDRDELGADELKRETLQKPAQNEEQRLERFDGVLKFHRGVKMLRRSDRMEWPQRATRGALPECETFSAEVANDFVA